jgi:hypothetical protein
MHGKVFVTAASNHGAPPSLRCSCMAFHMASRSDGEDEVLDNLGSKIVAAMPRPFHFPPIIAQHDRRAAVQQQAHGSSPCFRWLAWSMAYPSLVQHLQASSAPISFLLHLSRDDSYYPARRPSTACTLPHV